MHVRDLFLSLMLFAGAGWLAVAFPADLGRPAYVLAVAGCALAAGVYFVAGTGRVEGDVVAGRHLSRIRLRALSQALLGVSMTAIGFSGYVADGDAVSGVIAAVGIGVIALGRILWTQGDPEVRAAADEAAADEAAADKAVADEAAGDDSAVDAAGEDDSAGDAAAGDDSAGDAAGDDRDDRP